ncbi:glutamate 5-kinase [Fontivita pretiosa]|uniref:glutamate 5-kinase n=1 Tax=Fontivita pretiosa TaxID=2989684 RepID=UPI003D1794B5
MGSHLGNDDLHGRDPVSITRMQPAGCDSTSQSRHVSGYRSRQQILAPVRSLVVKLGTQLLSDKQARLDTAYVASIAQQVASLRRQRKITVTIVSSGAIGAGLRELNLSRRPTDLARLQAVAAVGQRRLMDVWADAFEPFGMPVAQLLLTREDIDNRTRFLNVRNTILAAHELGAVPIINENDTISTDELIKISFGDNDILAALVATAMRADLLVLLTVVDGILDGSGKPLRLVENLDAAQQLVRAEKTALGKGGMDSKLRAARMVLSCGESMVVADGRMENVLPRLLAGEEIGTLFTANGRRRTGKDRWIGAARTVGTIVIDDGAVKALVERNKSLLPAGIVRVDGHFARGDVVAIANTSGQVVARGLTNYSADDIKLIQGKKTSEVRALLKEQAYDEVVHRDNLVVG